MFAHFHGRLLNSASPWATTKEQLAELYNSPYTGAVTVRTSLLNGWKHDDRVNQWLFYDSRINAKVPVRSPNANSSFNTLGYSPIALPEYLEIIRTITNEAHAPKAKPFVVSVTGTPQDIVQCRRLIAKLAAEASIPLLMEINLSCPNIPDVPPPAYSTRGLQEFLFALQKDAARNRETTSIPVGIKTSPYTYRDQFSNVIDALVATTVDGAACPIDFITATNTLGNCLLMEGSDSPSAWAPALSSASPMGLGGIGGATLHALSLGNVRTLRAMLDQHETLKAIEIIGVGGVSDFLGFSRMRSAGAAAVAIGTAFGRDGIDIFYKIAMELKTVSRAAGGTGP